MAEPQGAREKQCILCGATMIYRPPTKPRLNDYFWKCPDCGAEVWPEDISVRDQIRRIMYEGMRARKKFGGKKSGRKRKQQKPGDKLRPWYIR